MKSFEHIEAESLEKAAVLSENFKGKAKFIAGGTDLLGVLKDEILPDYPEAIINIKTIPGLDHIKEDGGVLKIGALVRLSEIVTSPIINSKYKILVDAAESVGSPVIRRMGTIGGNLCQDVRCWYYRYPSQLGRRIMCYRKGEGSCPAVNGDNRYHAIMGGKGCFAVCPSDMAVALAALDAEIIVAGTDENRRIPVQEFFTPQGNVLETDEIVKEILIPLPPKGARQVFLKFRLRKSIDFGIVSVASIITVREGICENAKIVLGAVAPMPIRATEAENTIIRKPLNITTAEEAAMKAVIGTSPLSMNAFKVDITRVLVKQAILA